MVAWKDIIREAPAIRVHVVLAAVVAFFALMNRHYQLDDALIYYRYIQNALDGNGLVYNVGERFNALSSPLYAYLSLLTSGLFGSLQYPMIAQAALFHLATIVILYALFARYEMRWPFVALGAALIAVSRYFYSIYGMETPLFLLLCAACLWLYDLKKMFWFGIACALLLLTRGEGVFLVLALSAAHLIRRRPIPPASYFVVPLVLVGASLAFTRLYYGAFLPNSLSAKIDQGRSGLWGEWPLFLHASYQIVHFGNSTLLFAGLVILAVLGILRLGRRELNFVILAFLAVLALFYIGLNVPYYHWYYAPFYAFGYMYAGLGVAWLYDSARMLRATAAVRAARVAACMLAVGGLAMSAFATYLWPVSKSWRQDHYPAIGRWLAKNTPVDASIATTEVGIVGYYSKRRIVDIVGVVSPGNSAAVAEGSVGEWVRQYAPDFVLVHSPPWPPERGILASVMFGEYRVYKRFRFPGSVEYVLIARNDEPIAGSASRGN